MLNPDGSPSNSLKRKRTVADALTHTPDGGRRLDEQEDTTRCLLERQQATDARLDRLTQEHETYVRETDSFVTGMLDRNERERSNRHLLQTVCDRDGM